MLWYCQLQQNTKGNSGDMKPQGSYLPVAVMFLSWWCPSQLGQSPARSCAPYILHEPHIPVGAGYITLSHCQDVILIVRSVHVNLISTFCKWASILHFPDCSSTPFTLIISEGITHPLVFPHVGANKLLIYKFSAGALWTNIWQLLTMCFCRLPFTLTPPFNEWMTNMK